MLFLRALSVRAYSMFLVLSTAENVVDSSRFDRIDTNRTNRLKFVATFKERGRLMYRYFTDLDFRWAIQGG